MSNSPYTVDFSTPPSTETDMDGPQALGQTLPVTGKKPRRMESVVVKLSDVHDQTLQKELQMMDKNNDGSLTLDEVLRGARDLVNSRANMKLLKQLLGAMVVMLLLIVGVVCGLTAYIVAANQISKVDNNNQLLNKENSQPVTVAQSMTRIPLGALYLFPESLPLLKDITYEDPTTDILHVKSVDRVELVHSQVLLIYATDGMMVRVAGIEASFTAVDNMGNLTDSFSICSACSSCASHSFPSTPQVTNTLATYFNSIDIDACATLTNFASSNMSNVSAEVPGKEHRRDASVMTSHARRSHNIASFFQGRFSCSARSPPPPPPDMSRDWYNEIQGSFLSYFEFYDGRLKPTQCPNGCATWTSMRGSFNGRNQGAVDSKWGRYRHQQLAGSFCAQPANDRGQTFWCFCRDQTRNRDIPSWSYCA